MPSQRKQQLFNQRLSAVSAAHTGGGQVTLVQDGGEGLHLKTMTVVWRNPAIGLMLKALDDMYGATSWPPKRGGEDIAQTVVRKTEQS